MKKEYVAGIAVLALVLLGALGVALSGGEEVDCQRVYNQTLEDQMPPADIPERCRPLPEDIENRLLAQALAEG